MARSDEYRGPERRARDEWQIAIEKRMDRVEMETRENTRHAEKIEEQVSELTDGVDVMKGTVRTIKHDLANNTLITDGTSSKVRDIATKIDAIGATTTAMHAANESILQMMETWDAFNRVASTFLRFTRWVVPLLSLAAAAWSAIKIFGKR